MHWNVAAIKTKILLNINHCFGFRQIVQLSCAVMGIKIVQTWSVLRIETSISAI